MVKSTALGLWQFFLINQNLKDKSVEVVMCGDFFAEILYVFVSILGFSKNTKKKKKKQRLLNWLQICYIIVIYSVGRPFCKS